MLAEGAFFTVTPESYSWKAWRKAAWESAGSFLSQARTEEILSWDVSLEGEKLACCILTSASYTQSCPERAVNVGEIIGKFSGYPQQPGVIHTYHG